MTDHREREPLNDPAEAADLMRVGIAGIYTDDLLP